MGNKFHGIIPAVLTPFSIKEELDIGSLLEIIDWSLLLIDEPFNGLDFGGQQFVMKKMDAWQDGKRSIIFVDHDIERILKISSRIIILNQHSIALDEQVDSPELKSKMKKLLN